MTKHSSNDQHGPMGMSHVEGDYSTSRYADFGKHP